MSTTYYQVRDIDPAERYECGCAVVLWDCGHKHSTLAAAEICRNNQNHFGPRDIDEPDCDFDYLLIYEVARSTAHNAVRVA